MVSNAFAAWLRAGRSDFNERFAAARLRFTSLDGEAFGAFLHSSVDVLVSAVAQAQPDRVGAVVSAAYDAALDVVGQGLAGPAARHPWIETGWRRVLPAAASLVAMAPSRLIASVSNALHHLATTSGARPDAWVDALEKNAAACDTPETFLRFGQVAAWRAGLAHYRAGALAAADMLPEPLALKAVQAPAATGSWAGLRARFACDPWFDPSADDRPDLAVALRVGEFRGFGGLFTEPPQVTVDGGQLLVASGPDAWCLMADAFGATFHAAPSDRPPTRPTSLPAEFRTEKAFVRRGSATLRLPDLSEISSAAALPRTLALTSPQTYSVILVALA